MTNLFALLQRHYRTQVLGGVLEVIEHDTEHGPMPLVTGGDSGSPSQV